MLAWSVAVAVGVALALLGYAGRVAERRAPLAIVAAIARGVAAALVTALLLDAPRGAARPPAPLVALDVSSSWLRADGPARYDGAADAAAKEARDTLLLFGDSLRAIRPSTRPARPADQASRVAPAVDRAVATGRPLILHTDGVLDDPGELRWLPSGSEVRISDARSSVDAAVVALDAPRAAVGGDTIEVGIRIGVGSSPVPGGVVRLLLDSAVLDSAHLDPLGEWGEQTPRMRVVLPQREGTSLLTAIVRVDGDLESRNDSLAAPIELSAVAGVTVVSTAPDFDLRYMLEVLRGTTALPTRAYMQVAPGQWRREGSLAPVSGEVVMDAARRAPILVLHGDTAALGATRSLGTGAQLLMATPPGGVADALTEWYAVSAPPSPIAALLGGAEWDSLPPLAVGASVPGGDWTGLVVQRARRFERRAAVAGTESPRRRVVVGVNGLWRWMFRGGVSADAFTAVWGGIFDWLAAERRDARAALPDGLVLRAGEPITWRRGAADTAVNVVLRRRGASDSMSLVIRFEQGSTTARSAALPTGVYDIEVPGGRSLLAVNSSRELLPLRPTVNAGPVGGAPPAVAEPPRLSSANWPFVLIVLLLCAEWLARRRAGLR